MGKQNQKPPFYYYNFRDRNRLLLYSMVFYKALKKINVKIIGDKNY
jgi:hypothetical protein